MRVAMFQEIIAPYRIPVFNEVHANANFEFKVFFLSKTQNERLWPIPQDEIHFPYEVLPGFRWEGKNLRAVHVNWGIFLRLFTSRFDVIVTGGWHQPIYLILLLYAKLFRKKFLIWTESHEGDVRTSNPISRFLRRFFARQSSGAIVAGTSARDYLASLGANPKKIWTAPNAIDSSFYIEKSRALLPRREALKTERKLPRWNLLFVGRLVSEKGVRDLLSAYANLVQHRNDLGLLVCGEGEERPVLEEFCRDHHLTRVRFLGFQNRDELAAFYVMSDLLIVPSHTEPWGLVVNEALTCGLPVIASNRVGAAADLIIPGENGFVVSPGDVQELTARIEELLSNPNRLNGFRGSAQRLIQSHSPQVCAEGFIQAVREA